MEGRAERLRSGEAEVIVGREIDEWPTVDIDGWALRGVDRAQASPEVLILELFELVLDAAHEKDGGRKTAGNQLTPRPQCRSFFESFQMELELLPRITTMTVRLR